MSHAQLAKPHHPDHDVPEEREQPELPVEPDEGPIPAVIPDDPEHKRLIDPAAAVAHTIRSSDEVKP
jgi:hypothetical protein